MKEKLKKKFDALLWTQTFELRALDMAKNLPTISMKNQWPGLYTIEGVFFYIQG